MIDRQRLLRYGRDQFSAWLPALMTLLFALGTWWLVRSAPRIVDGASQAPASPDPDYFMRDFSVRVFNPDGQLQAELKGGKGLHFPVDDILEVTQPRMRSFDEQGRLTTGAARRGVSNADASDIKLYGDARVVRLPVAKADGAVTPQLEFRGEFLHAFVKDKRVSSDQPVELWRGSDVVTGDVFDYDDKSGVANLRGRVRGTIQPTPSTQQQSPRKRPQASASRSVKAHPAQAKKRR
ncbi:MAG: LPS export ABC transporter periplasmic protein LptC [Desulfovibrionaceae bacterium]|nr:LPS export ABC transporter periplasmic protein LptC [Desulfovibrionaceae bacterium]